MTPREHQLERGCARGRQRRGRFCRETSRRALGCLVILGWLTASAGGALADDGARPVSNWVERIFSSLSKASDARRIIPTPPTPRSLRFSPKRLGSISAGAEVLDVVAVSRRDQLAWVAVLTAVDLIVLERSAKGFVERQRFALGEGDAAIRPRDRVGVLLATDMDGDGRDELVARTSDHASALVLVWHEEEMTEGARAAGFPLCRRVRGELVPGRNAFDQGSLEWVAADEEVEVPTWLTSLRCREDLIDAQGVPLLAVAAVDPEGQGMVELRRRCALVQPPCEERSVRVSIDDVGYAFLLSDPDSDGVIDLVMSSNAPRGETDKLTVLAIAASGMVKRFERSFHGGIVGIVEGAFSRVGARDLVVAVRLAGSTRVDLWGLQ